LVGLFALGLPFSLGFQALRNVSSALGRPRPALYVMGATIVFNGVMDYVLIFGRFGAPRLGLLGAGLATSSSYVFSALAMALVMRLSRRLRRVRPLRRFWRFDRRTYGEILRLGMPIGLTMMFEGMIFNAMTIVMGTFGAAALAAHQIAMNVASITFMGPLGVGMAGTIRVGLAAGADDFAGVRRAGYAAATLGLGFIAVCAVAMAAFGRQIAGLYVSGGGLEDLKVVALAASFLRVAAAFQLFDALQVVSATALRGLKDARAPMVIAGASYWLAGAPACLILGFALHLGGLGIWYGLAFGLCVAGVSLAARFVILSRG
jgi:MATE family multidrug resistance protein